MEKSRLRKRIVADFLDRIFCLLWKGVLLIEQKSRGKNLDRAYKQAAEYFPGLTDDELPRYILVSDFEKPPFSKGGFF